MIYQLIILFILFLFAINLFLNLLLLKRPLEKKELLKTAPMVSVLIPARNEETNIGNCLESLLRQNYPNFEIIVLDDNSSDDTATITSKIAARDNRIRLIKGDTLTEGWAGKPFACHQLAKQARGAWLLFVDADTVHEPNMLSSVTSMAIEYKPALISGFPRQITSSPLQQAAIPMLYFIIFGWLPLWWLQRRRKPLFSLAVGQFLYFKAEDYWRMDGHQVVKNRILEDVWMGIEIIRRGGRLLTLDLSRVVSCEMYRDVGEMKEGFMRWVCSVASVTPLATAGLLIAVYLFYLAPYYWLWWGFIDNIYSVPWHIIIICQVLLIFIMRWQMDSRLRSSMVSPFLHPFGVIFLFVAASQGIFNMIRGAGVSWKKRYYGKNSYVE